MRFTDNAELTAPNMENADILAGTDVSADTDKKFTLEGLAKWIVEYYDGSSLAGNEQTLKDAIDNGGGGGGGDTPVSWFFTLAANEIATGADLNSITSIGTYRASGSAVSSTLQNCPISDQGFVMRVMYGAVGAVVHQIIISAKGDLMYMRRISTNGGAPTPWTSLGGSGIPAPATASAGDFLVYNGTAWVAQALATWQGGNY